MKQKPQIKIALSKTDRLLEIIGWALVFAIWCLLLSSYSKLPNSIPSHYRITGEPDRYSAKATIFILPLIATVLYAGMTLLNRFPHIYNYPFIITEDNALRQYTRATRMIRYLKLIVVVILGLIMVNTISNANDRSNGLGVWLLPLVLALFVIPTAYFIITSLRTNNRNTN